MGHKMGKIKRVVLGVLTAAILFMSTAAIPQGNIAARKISFELSDNHGRLVKSDDYMGIPLFLEFGACW